MSVKEPAPTNADDFAKGGAAYIQAFDILLAGCKVPPSLDVFSNELMIMRSRNTEAITPQYCAQSIVSRYQQIK